MGFRLFFDVKKKELLTVTLLFLNFFFIIVTYYIAKPVRSALVVTNLGSDALPYIWILVSIFLGLFVSIYSELLVNRLRRDKLIALTTGFFILCVLAIRWLLNFNIPWLSGLFYLWSDVFSVIMVEQFWSFCNDIFDTNQAKRLYGIIGGGGILGGVGGSALTNRLVPWIGTSNLLYVCAIVLSLVVVFTYFVQMIASPKRDVKENLPVADRSKSKVDFFDGFKLVGTNPYLRSILIVVLLTQAVSNMIDYQFNVSLEKQFIGMDTKTTFISDFYFWLNLFSFFLMSVITSPLQRMFGLLGSLLILPGTDFLGMAIHLMIPSVTVVYGLKFFDKALNYSISRASKEILYIPTSQESKYKAKAVIDMFAFRFSKIISVSIIVPFTTILPLGLFNYATLGLAFILVLMTWKLGVRYLGIMKRNQLTCEG